MVCQELSLHSCLAPSLSGLSTSTSTSAGHEPCFRIDIPFACCTSRLQTLVSSIRIYCWHLRLTRFTLRPHSHHIPHPCRNQPSKKQIFRARCKSFLHDHTDSKTVAIGEVSRRGRYILRRETSTINIRSSKALRRHRVKLGARHLISPARETFTIKGKNLD
jgi:hypothetical protein